jgi:hypothetical protein
LNYSRCGRTADIAFKGQSLRFFEFNYKSGGVVNELLCILSEGRGNAVQSFSKSFMPPEVLLDTDYHDGIFLTRKQDVEQYL